jgi:hypothetical protein
LVLLRHGSYGIDRKHVVDKLFKLIVDYIVPPVQKYFFWSAEVLSNNNEILKDIGNRKKISKYDLPKSSEVKK